MCYSFLISSKIGKNAIRDIYLKWRNKTRGNKMLSPFLCSTVLGMLSIYGEPCKKLSMNIEKG
jgi:hypothetical protein